MNENNDDKELIARLNGGIELCLTRQKPYFLPFMSERKQALLLDELGRSRFENFMFFAGYDGGERKMLGLFCGKPNVEVFPISALEFRFRACDKLSHRDFLGSLMSLGIERETVGDILIEDGRAVIFVKAELKDYISSQLSKVGRVGVKIHSADLSALPQGRGVSENTCIVASLRLDCILAAACGLSREKAKSAVACGSVCVNYREARSADAVLREGDVFTVRGKGKFVFKCVLGSTRKGRTLISVIHYR